MKIFISWSGSRSQKIAYRLNDFLKILFAEVETFFSVEDIEAGKTWFAAISSQLEVTNFGVMCLTSENRSNPWILFEAGALAKDLRAANVCPILFGLTKEDIDGPLAQFQLTSFSSDDMFKICSTINSKLERPLLDKNLRKLFDSFWPETENALNELVNTHAPQFDILGKSQKQLVEEILFLMKQRSKSEDLKLGATFIEEIIQSLHSHVLHLRSSRADLTLNHLSDVLRPLDYMISQVVDSKRRGLLIQKYEEFESLIRTY